ncbi:hypothetical protein, partial [Streptomyces sp. NPDC091215]|uniref:hypothetical protein n=1 Tax=Streptomyces sp. NPDC091215 TaxID=3155192 RepID=UPI0034213A33
EAAVGVADADARPGLLAVGFGAVDEDFDGVGDAESVSVAVPLGPASDEDEEDDAATARSDPVSDEPPGRKATTRVTIRATAATAATANNGPRTGRHWNSRSGCERRR